MYGILIVSAPINIDAKIEEHISKRLKESSTPGKKDAVFLLNYQGANVGTAFSISATHVLSSRHNLYDENTPIGVGDLALLDELQAKIPLRVISGGLNGADWADDWVLLERTDGGTFRKAIAITPTTTDQIKDTRPYITIYHYPVSFQVVESSVPALVSSSNRLIMADKGLLRCNDLSLISKGSCGRHMLIIAPKPHLGSIWQVHHRMMVQETGNLLMLLITSQLECTFLTLHRSSLSCATSRLFKA